MSKKALRRGIETIQLIEEEVTKQRLWIARRKAGIAEQQRKADTRKKIQLGGTVIAAGLGETPYPELRNVLAEAKGILDWERDGKAR